MELGGTGATDLQEGGAAEGSSESPPSSIGRPNRRRWWGAAVATCVAGAVAAAYFVLQGDVKADLVWGSALGVDAPGTLRVSMPTGDGSLVPARPGEEVLITSSVFNAGDETVRIVEVPPFRTPALEPLGVETYLNGRSSAARPFQPLDLAPRDFRYFAWRYRWRTDCSYEGRTVDVDVGPRRVALTPQGTTAWQTQEASYEVDGDRKTITFDLIHPVVLVGVDAMDGCDLLPRWMED